MLSAVSLKELHRVLRPGGSLCLIWNMEDEGEPLVAALRAVYERYDEGIPQYRLGVWKQVRRWKVEAGGQWERTGGGQFEGTVRGSGGAWGKEAE